MDPSIEDRLKAASDRIERLEKIVQQCNADWLRLKAWIIAGNGRPEEFFRFRGAALKNGGKGVEIFIDYITSLWAEIDALERIIEKS